MIDIERQIRLHLPDFPDFPADEPETRVSGLWLWALAIAGILTIGAIVAVVLVIKERMV